MRILYFDCFSGISGDMTIAALLDLGVDRHRFLAELEKLALDGYKINIEKVTRQGIAGTDVQVILKEHEPHEELRETSTHVDPHYEQQEQHEHRHDHHHEHAHPASVHSKTQHVHTHAHTARNLYDIEEIIHHSKVSEKVKSFSKQVFREIAKAEAKVHGKTIEEVHFHEVGAVDSIVDIVGVAICLDLLNIDQVFASPIHDGKGFIHCQHGRIPVPVPAVVEMLKGSGIPLVTEDINTELVTPTGMGIIKCLSSGFGIMPPMTVMEVGYGMGKRETGSLNALRVFMGETTSGATLDEIAVLETNIDNINSEHLGFIMEGLMEHGALDVFFAPIYMKKNRPAVLVTVLAELEQEESLADILFRETPTLGIRRSRVKRYRMERKIVKVLTSLGEVGIKVASKGAIHKYSPEYEDCKALAKKSGCALSKVYEEAMAVYKKTFSC